MNVSRTGAHVHRSTKRRHVDAYDALAWCIFTGTAVAMILAACALLLVAS